jgi:hypothetical protein
MGLIYFLVSFHTQDPVWFWPIFDYQPSAIIVHCDGRTISLAADSPQFIPLTHLINQQISLERHLDGDMIGDMARQEFLREGYVSIELHYPQPVRIHSPHTYFAQVDSLLMVLSGKQSHWTYLYASYQNDPLPGSIRVTPNQAIAEFVVQHRLCPIPCEER